MFAAFQIPLSWSELLNGPQKSRAKLCFQRFCSS